MSGATKQAWSQAQWERQGGYSFNQNLQETLQVPVFGYELLVAVGLCACFLLVWWSTRHSRSREEGLFLVFMVGVFSLAAGHLAKFTQTVLFIYPRLGQEPWYFVPAYLMMALVVPVICYTAVHFVRRLRRLPGSKSSNAVRYLVWGIIVAGALVLVTETDFRGPFNQVKYESRSNFQGGDRAWAPSYLVARVMNRVLQEGSIVGTWDAGIIGYFLRFPVVNLDGLVNSYEYLHMPKIRGERGSIPPKYGGKNRNNSLRSVC